MLRTYSSSAMYGRALWKWGLLCFVWIKTMTWIRDSQLCPPPHEFPNWNFLRGQVESIDSSCEQLSYCVRFSFYDHIVIHALFQWRVGDDLMYYKPSSQPPSSQVKNRESDKYLESIVTLVCRRVTSPRTPLVKLSEPKCRHSRAATPMAHTWRPAEDAIVTETDSVWRLWRH